MKRLTALLAIAAIAAFLAWRWYGAVEVSVTTPARGPAVRAVYATGNVEPVTWAKVTPMLQGRIVDLCKCEGEAVDEGTPLVRLDDSELQAQLEELAARREFLEHEVGRQRELERRNVVSSKSLEQVRSELNSVVAAMEAARVRLGRMVLRAPMDGVVLRRDGEVGEVVGTGDVVMWVGKPKPLWIVADVDEEDIPQVTVGQTTLIRADAWPERNFEGTVHQITPKGDPVNKSYRVRVALPDDTPLRIGMTTEINIVVDRRDDALLVPVTALKDGAVWTVTDGRARRAPVETGIIGTSTVEITGGLAADTRIVRDPPEGLADGDRVRVSEDPPDSP